MKSPREYLFVALLDAAEQFAADRVVLSMLGADLIDDITAACGPWPLDPIQEMELTAACEEALSEPALRLVCPQWVAILEAALADAIGCSRANLVHEMRCESVAKFERRHPFVSQYGDETTGGAP